MSMSVIGMDKRMGRAFVTIAVSLIGALTTTAGAQRRLQMEVQVTPPDPSRMGKAPFSIGKIAPTPVLVDQYFNDSTGVGDDGETDARGPWNEGGDWEIVEAAQLEEGVENLESGSNEDTNQSGKPARRAVTTKARKRA